VEGEFSRQRLLRAGTLTVVGLLVLDRWEVAMEECRRCSSNQCTQDKVASLSSSTVLNGPWILTHSFLYKPIADSAIALS
jgi:hypothetical protein